MRENLISRKALSPVTPTKLAHQQKSSQYLDALLQPFLDPRLAPQKHHREIESLKPTEYLNIRKIAKKAILQNKCRRSHRPWPIARPIPFLVGSQMLLWSPLDHVAPTRMGNKTKTWPDWPQTLQLYLSAVQIGQFHLLLLIEKLSQHHSPICFLRRNLSSSALASIK